MQVFGHLIADCVAIFLNVGPDIALRVDGKLSVRVISAGRKEGFLTLTKVLGVLGVPGVVAVLLVGGTPHSGRDKISLLPEMTERCVGES